MEITATHYPNTNSARNAMITHATKSAGPHGEVDGQPAIRPGVDGVRFQTSFYPPDGNTDWAFSFAENATLVTIKTDQQGSAYAYNVGLEIVDEF